MILMGKYTLSEAELKKSSIKNGKKKYVRIKNIIAAYSFLNNAKRNKTTGSTWIKIDNFY